MMGPELYSMNKAEFSSMYWFLYPVLMTGTSCEPLSPVQKRNGLVGECPEDHENNQRSRTTLL